MNTKSNYEHRTATKALKLVLADGSPVKSKEVLFTQTNHKFLFGCAGFDSVPLTNGYLNDEKKEETAASFRKFFKIFNYATLPFYWGRFESQQGAPATEQLKKAAQWLVSQGCTVKGHPLCWHTNTAEWLLNMNNADILATQLERINREVTDFKGLIDILTFGMSSMKMKLLSCQSLINMIMVSPAFVRI